MWQTDRWTDRQNYDSQNRASIAASRGKNVRRHRNTTYIGLTVTNQAAWSVIWSVSHSSEPCKNGWTNWDDTWDLDSGGPKEVCITWGCTLAPPGEYHWTVHVWQWCGLLSNYFDHLLQLLCISTLKELTSILSESRSAVRDRIRSDCSSTCCLYGIL